MLSLLFAALLGCTDPVCVPVGGDVTATRWVDCQASSCDYDVEMTGGVGPFNNYVTYTPNLVSVQAPGAFEDFKVTGIQETDLIWLQKTLRGCVQASSTIPCTTIVERFTVKNTCP